MTDHSNIYSNSENGATSKALRLQRQVALVTGAGSGIGRASAIQLAAEGAKVCLVDVHEGDSLLVQREIEAAGGEAFVAKADISQSQQVEHSLQLINERWGRLDIVFANAGINGMLTPIENMEIEDWNRTVDINLTGTFITVKHAIPYLKERGGSIIITSSINGNRVFSNFGMSAYSTSKAGQVAFMQMAALELAQYRIRVNAICPGAIDTHIGESTILTPELKKIEIPIVFPEGNQPLSGRSGKAKEVADLVVFLASKEAKHITGTPIYIDGAESLLR